MLNSEFQNLKYMLTCKKVSCCLRQTCFHKRLQSCCAPHVEEVSEENEDIVKVDYVDILHVEVSTRSMAQKMCVVVRARSVMLVVVATLTEVR